MQIPSNRLMLDFKPNDTVARGTVAIERLIDFQFQYYTSVTRTLSATRKEKAKIPAKAMMEGLGVGFENQYYLQYRVKLKLPCCITGL